MTKIVHRRGDTAYVKCGEGYRHPGALLATVKDTGNGYIAHFRSFRSSTQDYYVCLDYAQAYELVQGLSMFKQNKKASLRILTGRSSPNRSQAMKATPEMIEAGADAPPAHSITGEQA